MTMRPGHTLVLGGLLAASLTAACGDSLRTAPEAPSGGALRDQSALFDGKMQVRAVNGVELGEDFTGTAEAADSLAVTVRLKVKKDDPAIQSVLLMRVRPDSFPTPLGGAPARMEPGESGEVTVTTFRAPSGTHRYFVQGASVGGSVVFSDTVEVRVSRPRTWVRILSLNEAPLAVGGPTPVADEFRVRALVTVADSARVDRLALRRVGGTTIHLRSIPLAGGTTSTLAFTGYLALRGTYDVALDAERVDSASLVRVASSGPLAVQVTNSDVTRPVLRFPADGQTATGPFVFFQASDDRAVWRFGMRNLANACGFSTFAASPTPATTGTVSRSALLCLATGANAIERQAVDVAGNVSLDTVTVTLPPQDSTGGGGDTTRVAQAGTAPIAGLFAR